MSNFFKDKHGLKIQLGDTLKYSASVQQICFLLQFIHFSCVLIHFVLFKLEISSISLWVKTYFFNSSDVGKISSTFNLYQYFVQNTSKSLTSSILCLQITELILIHQL